MIGTGPYDSLREYLEAIEKHGKLIRIDEIDQELQNSKQNKNDFNHGAQTTY